MNAAEATDRATIRLVPLRQLVLRAVRSAGCRLCWRITGAVFASILIIESLILIPAG
jgi:hypothetical protein